jgi:hypothetical protein
VTEDGGEQMSLRAAARRANACNISDDFATVKHNSPSA